MYNIQFIIVIIHTSKALVSSKHDDQLRVVLYPTINSALKGVEKQLW